MTEMTNKQCDAFIESNAALRLFVCAGQWLCQHILSFNVGRAKTREAAITAYCDKYHPDWTPPVIHDAEWALGYAKEKCLTLQFCGDRIGSVVSRGKGLNPVVQQQLDEHIITTVENWQAEYDPDKPTQEQTAMELLGEIVTANATDLHLAIRNGYDFLKEVDHDQ